MASIVITAIEKTLTHLAMPCGLIWLALMGLTVLAWRRRQRVLLISLVMLLASYTLAGNGEFSKVLYARLEHDYRGIKPLEQGPYDAVFVLGGGLGVAANGEPQLEVSGDRVAVGARLYHAGRAELLVASGLDVPVPHGDPHDLADETAATWRQLGIPENRILQIHGRNTREEMAALRQLVDKHPEWKRLGLVTSAWHLPRALRLAKKRDLDLEPLPADFRGTAIDWHPWRLVIPSGYGFDRNQAVCKEFLARLAGQ